MKIYLLEYRRYIEKILASKEVQDPDSIIENHLIQTQFFQHERLIHLIVTALIAILLVIFIVASTICSNVGFPILSIILLILEAFYIKHYYFLENQTQKLYDDYNSLLKRKNGDGFEVSKNMEKIK